MKRRRIGFTIIELIAVMTIVGALSAIAVPKFRQVQRRATATQILGDFDVVRLAAMSFYVDSGYFPAEANAGSVPRNLKPYLPNNFTFTKPQWTLDYENWELKTQPRFTKTGVVIGVSIKTKDAALGETAMQLVGNTPTFTVGTKYTFLISAF